MDPAASQGTHAGATHQKVQGKGDCGDCVLKGARRGCLNGPHSSGMYVIGKVKQGATQKVEVTA